jgi:hypothetical protein
MIANHLYICVLTAPGPVILCLLYAPYVNMLVGHPNHLTRVAWT